MVPMYEQQKINLPWGNPQTQRKVNVLRQQLIYFSSASGTNSKSVNSKTDLVMASWFPMKVIRQLTKLVYADIGIEYTPSFDGYNSVQWNETPWS